MQNSQAGIFTEDRKMRELIALAKTVAQSKATVLIQGESGTGKERMAALIHESSSRKERPFIAINCAAIPENLLESELFGYERGAFTGAVSSKSGKFELAHGGTILLDEISEMDVRLQAKLLRVIQEGQVDRIGGRLPVAVDVRILATTNRSLAQCVREGSFREDLYYRLNVVNLTLPPLRERIGDVELLARRFLGVFAEKNGKRVDGLSSEAVALLNSHVWPGNVRELENVMERAVITCLDGRIQDRDIHLERGLPVSALGTAPGIGIGELAQAADPRDPNSGWLPGRTLDDIERNVILEALTYHQGNRTHTAKALGISIRTLRNKLADYRRIGLQV
jgi:two-component system response regulator FlrC